jgi:hypothetical protein
MQLCVKDVMKVNTLLRAASRLISTHLFVENWLFITVDCPIFTRQVLGYFSHGIFMAAYPPRCGFQAARGLRGGLLSGLTGRWIL